MLHELFDVIQNREANPKPGSYTNQLLTEGEDRIIQKVGEEAIEVLIAAKGEDHQRLIEEIADLTYHTLVLLAYKDITPDEIEAELRRRHRK